MSRGSSADVVCTEVIAVTGVCRPERRRIAGGLRGKAWEVRAGRRADVLDGIADVVADVAASDVPRAVIEFPSETEVDDLVSLFRCYDDAEPSAHLSAIVTVVDAFHILDDLRRNDYAEPLRDQQYRAPWAHVTATGIEYATHLVLVNWRVMSPARLSAVMSFLNHLNPQARLTLHRSRRQLEEFVRTPQAERSRPGWIRIIDGQHEPHVSDARVTALRYEQLRPLHTARLVQALRTSFGQPGALIRSAGICRLATRPGVIGKWNQVGVMVSLDPIVLPSSAMAALAASELAFVGIDLDAEGLRTALDACALTDDEFAAGPDYWSRIPDTLPGWTDPVAS